MSEAFPREIRGVMIPVSGGRLLLPNATVAEVISYTIPEKVDNAPEWLLGRLPWRGWRLPLVSFSILSGLSPTENVANAKVAVLKALGGNAKLPFVAHPAQGFPHVTTIRPGARRTWSPRRSPPRSRASRARVGAPHDSADSLCRAA